MTLYKEMLTFNHYSISHWIGIIIHFKNLFIVKQIKKTVLIK